jgi:twitching motility two-component system response regulator PilG
VSTKKKIMVIDDSKVIRKSAEMFLINEGYEVILVEDGFEALAGVMIYNPDLVFIDVLMPKIDGIQTTQIIKKNEQFKDLPVIFLSSKDGEFDKARGIMVGGTDYLTKPFTKDTIIAIAKKYTN